MGGHYLFVPTKHHAQTKLPDATKAARPNAKDRKNREHCLGGTALDKLNHSFESKQKGANVPVDTDKDRSKESETESTSEEIYHSVD